MGERVKRSDALARALGLLALVALVVAHLMVVPLAGCASTGAPGGAGDAMSKPLIESCAGRQAYGCAVQAEAACVMPAEATGASLVAWATCLATAGGTCAVGAIARCGGGGGLRAAPDTGSGELTSVQGALSGRSSPGGAACRDAASACVASRGCDSEAACVATTAACLLQACQ